MNAEKLAKAVLEGEDPKGFMMAGQPGRERAFLKQFCDDVQEALEHLDSGNGEQWPPPPGTTEDELDNGNFSRWNHLWRGLEKVRQHYGL